MVYGIVGSRSRTDREAVESFVDSLPLDATVVSGGCRGVDSWAVERAAARGLATQVLKPDMVTVRSRYGGYPPKHAVTEAMYERNRRIVEAADVLVAFVSSARTGGTEYTVTFATKSGKPVDIR